MKKYAFLGFQTLILVLALTGCNRRLSSRSDNDVANSPAGGPVYEKSLLSGHVLGQSWQALSATAQIETTSDSKTNTVIKLYGESVTKACNGEAYSTSPVATVILPSPLQRTEYLFNMDLPGSSNANPLVFSKNSDNLIAEFTKIRVDEMVPGQIDLSVYARATDGSSLVSEINGAVKVVDCSTAVNFSDWEDLVGDYELDSFDGVRQDRRSSTINLADHDFYDRREKKWLKAVIFPLYSSISGNGDSQYEFGPMDGLGTTTKTRQNGNTVLTYSYHGSVYTFGSDVTLNLDITMIRSYGQIEVSYALEVPGHVKLAKHHFVLAMRGAR